MRVKGLCYGLWARAASPEALRGGGVRQGGNETHLHERICDSKV